LLIAATVYHFIHVAVHRRDRAFLWAMLPKWRDVTDLLDVIRFNLGLSTTAPKFAKFNYAEKMEYWAFLWGTAVMAASGLFLWFNNFALRHFPKWTTDAATAVHWYEALLATFSILLWHLYFVIFDPLVYPMDLAWLNGRIPAEHYEHSRPEYLAELRKNERAKTTRPEDEKRVEDSTKSEPEPDSH
jgi:cytochrome b subunit of formate dehydrogenase